MARSAGISPYGRSIPRMTRGEAEGLWVAQCELSEGLRLRPVNDDPPEAYERARVLVRRDRQPLGFVEVGMVGGQVPAQELQRVTEQLSSPPTLRTETYTEGPGERSLAFTVAICTRDRPGLLARCLDSVRRLDYPDLEILIVDNAPQSFATRNMIDEVAGTDDRIRYVEEPRPGLSNARNRALVEARHGHIAFTDDDVVVDEWWLEGLARGFRLSPAVACVTGLVPVARLATGAERFFDSRVSWSERLAPAVFDLIDHRATGALFPYQAGLFGTGANFSVDRDHLIALGGFDPSLGAGSPTSGGEDLDAFVRVIRSSRMLAYEPSAIVWHFHRQDLSGLQRQMGDYGRGLTAVVTKWLTQPETRSEVLVRVGPALAHLWGLWARSARLPPVGPSIALRFTLAEVAGALTGPLRYLWCRHKGADSAATLWRYL